MAKDPEAWICIKKCSHPGCYNDATCNGDRCVKHIRSVKKQKSYAGCKSPKSEALHLGVELECFAEHSEGHKALLAQNIIPHTDGSLPYYGAEFKLCGTPDKIMAQAPNLARRITAVGGQVNGKCGFHVHMDARNVGWERRQTFISWLTSWEDWWFSLMPPSRQHNEYCQKLAGRSCAGRYGWVHTSNHKTIEMRLHSGTLCPHKIRGWLAVCADLMRLFNGTDEFPVVEFVTDTQRPTPEFLAQVFGTEAREYLHTREKALGVLTTTDRTGRTEVA